MLERISTWLKGFRPESTPKQEQGDEGWEQGFGAEPEICAAIVKTLTEQRNNRIERGFYWENQIAFAYNSQKIEGSALSKDQTRLIFETGTIGGEAVPLSDAEEAANHFRLFDRMLDTLDRPLSKELLLEFHGVLKTGVKDARQDGFPVGEWKTIPNAVGNVQTTAPENVDAEIGRLLDAYNAMESAKSYRTIAAFHVAFERIHPFQDGNGRVGRMVAFRECLANGLVPFIVLDEEKARYYDGLERFDEQPTKLVGFFRDMRELYLREFSALIPSFLLLPRYRREYVDEPRDFVAEFESAVHEPFSEKAGRLAHTGGKRADGKRDRDRNEGR